MPRLGIALVCLVLASSPIRVTEGQLGVTDELVNGSKAEALSNKGVELMHNGDNASARKFLDAAIREDPGAYILYFNRAICFKQMHQWQPALQDLSSCLRLKPTFNNAVIIRASVNNSLGNYRDSLADYNALLRLYSGVPGFLDFRAWLFATCPDPSIRNGPAAIADATLACKVSVWDYPTYIDTLAAAYAETHDFDSAVRFEEKAIAKGRKQKWDTTDMEKRLTLYHQHQPYREPRGGSARAQSAPAKMKKHD